MMLDDGLLVDHVLAEFVSEAVTLGFQDTELSATGDPTERFLQNSGDDMAAGFFRMSMPAHRAGFDNVLIVIVVLFDRRKLVAKVGEHRSNGGNAQFQLGGQW